MERAKTLEMLARHQRRTSDLYFSLRGGDDGNAAIKSTFTDNFLQVMQNVPILTYDCLLSKMFKINSGKAETYEQLDQHLVSLNQAYAQELQLSSSEKFDVSVHKFIL